MKKTVGKKEGKNPSGKRQKNGLTDHIRLTPRPIRDPQKVEHFRSDEGERMTRVFYGPGLEPVLVSADEIMKGGRMFPASLVIRNPWHFLGPWLETPELIFEKFWKCYRSESAEKEREIAVRGPKFCNRAHERDLLNHVHEYKALSLQQFGFELGKDERRSVLASTSLSDAERSAVMAGLKEKMVDWLLEAVWNDHEAPKRLHELLKNNDAVKSVYEDQLTVNGRVFNEFVKLLAREWHLPNKKSVRIAAGLGRDTEGITAASRSFKSLGLDGLPKG